MTCMLLVPWGIIKMVQISLDLRCLRISWMLILYFDLNPCYLLEVPLWMRIGSSTNRAMASLYFMRILISFLSFSSIKCLGSSVGSEP